MTALYTFVDDFLHAYPAQAQWRRSPNRAPAFTDAEVITIGLRRFVFGYAPLKKAYLLIPSGWRNAFPRLCNYQQTSFSFNSAVIEVAGICHAGVIAA